MYKIACECNEEDEAEAECGEPGFFSPPSRRIRTAPSARQLELVRSTRARQSQVVCVG